VNRVENASRNIVGRINLEEWKNTHIYIYIYIFLYVFLKSIIVYRHTGWGTCQNSRYNIVIHEYYALHIDKDTYYVSRYNIVKHEFYTLHIDIDTYYVNGSGIYLYL
jgi:hypothetical protein